MKKFRISFVWIAAGAVGLFLAVVYFVQKIIPDLGPFEFLGITGLLLILFSFFLYFTFKRRFIQYIKSLFNMISIQRNEKTLDPSTRKEKSFKLMDSLFHETNRLFSKMSFNLMDLQKSKGYSDVLMKTAQVSIILLDENMKPVFINDYGLRTFEINNEDYSSLKPEYYIKKSVLLEMQVRLKKSKHVLNQEAHVRLESGKRLDVDISVSKLFNHEGKVTGLLAVVQDVTAKKKAEVNLKNQISFSQKIFQTIPDLIIITDRKLNVLFVNRHADNLISLPDIQGGNISKALSREAVESGFDEFLKHIINDAEKIKQMNVLNPFMEGENYVDITIEPLKAEDKIIGSLILIRDVAEWRNLTEKLKNLQDYTGMMVNSSPFATISVNADNIITLWNSHAETLFGVPIEVALNQTLFEVHDSFVRFKDIINEVKVFNKTIQMGDEKIDLREEKFVVCNLTFYPIQSEGQNVVIHIQDITDKKMLEDTLMQAYKMESLGLMTSSIIHDFNNVLSGILGYASLLKEVIYADPKLQKYVSNILASGEKASSMIRQILEYSKKRVGKKEVMDINEVITESLDFLQLNLKIIEVQRQLSPDQIMVFVDKTKISQVMINLIVNAREALRHKPHPKISVKTELKNVSYHKSLPDGSYAVIYVSDNGHGIKKENLEKIFEPFFTTKEKVKGTGIGLSTVKDIVTENRGWIDVDSEEGKGTTFSLGLPVYAEKIEKEELPPKPVVEALQKNFEGTVLLIDDEEVIREIGKDMLKSLNLECITAENGERGIELFKKYEDQICLVILDVEMPGVSGEKVFQLLKKLKPSIRILLISGYGKEYLEKKVFNGKIKHFMPKPFQLNQLSRQLNQIME